MAEFIPTAKIKSPIASPRFGSLINPKLSSAIAGPTKPVIIKTLRGVSK